MPYAPHYRPSLRYLLLGPGFADRVKPASFPRHVLRFRNQRWAERLGLGPLTDDEWTRAFARFEPLLCNLHEPLALRYHGHQFGVYNPGLGDGRGFLFAQLLDPETGRLVDLGTKGSGTTPWSRGGDGRLTLKGGVREVLATEMLEALGVLTSRTLSLFETGEMLHRGDEPSPTRSSVLVRASWSHVRFGTFQRLAHVGDAARGAKLLRWAAEHYVREIDATLPDVLLAPAFLRVVAERTGRLVASWMLAGFVHGVLNTDNMTITGESFDYGPYRFLPRYDPAFTAAYFDHEGRYAFGRQPEVGAWNVRRLGDALRTLGLSTPEPIDDAVSAYEPAFRRALGEGMARRLGMEPLDADTDQALVAHVNAFLEESPVGYERFFFDAFGGDAARMKGSPAAEAYAGARFDDLAALLRRYARGAASRALEEHPYFAAREPETMLIDEVEAIWASIAENDDWRPFEEKIARVRRMSEARATRS